MSKHTPQQLQNKHVPVLLEDVLDLLAPQTGDSYLDLTAGYGGHAKEVLARTNNAKAAVLVDRDEMALASLGDIAEQGATLLRSDFLSAARQLADAGKTFDLILADLGVSSPQINSSEIGFSFSHNGPLDMRMDGSQELDAKEVVNRYSEDQLTELIRTYGEELPAKARRIAHAICLARPIATTEQLATLIKRAYRSGRLKTHPATRTFQAIRIVVNKELEQLEGLLPLLPQLLNPGGRVAIISFHSLEDRLVKQFFLEQARAGYEATIQLLTKKPLSGETESVYNPRARSAKLRAAVKIKTERT